MGPLARLIVKNEEHKVPSGLIGAHFCCFDRIYGIKPGWEILRIWLMIDIPYFIKNISHLNLSLIFLCSVRIHIGASQCWLFLIPASHDQCACMLSGG